MVQLPISQGWATPGQHADSTLPRFDLKRGWLKPGEGVTDRGLQYVGAGQAGDFDPSSIDPGWHTIISPKGTPAPIGAINYTPATQAVHAQGMQAPVDQDNVSFMPLDTFSSSQDMVGSGQGVPPGLRLPPGLEGDVEPQGMVGTGQTSGVQLPDTLSGDSGGSPIFRQAPDGSWMMWDGEKFIPAPGMPAPTTPRGSQEPQTITHSGYVWGLRPGGNPQNPADYTIRIGTSGAPPDAGPETWNTAPFEAPNGRTVMRSSKGRILDLETGQIVFTPPNSPQQGAGAQGAVRANPNLGPSVSGMTDDARGGLKFSPYDPIIRKYAGDLAGNDEFVAIVASGILAESGGDPTAGLNGEGVDHGDSVGIYQINKVHGLPNSVRTSPDQSSAFMVPKYAAAYKARKAQGLTGAELAKAVAADAEISDPKYHYRYADAYNQIMGGGVGAFREGLPDSGGGGGFAATTGSAGGFFSPKPETQVVTTADGSQILVDKTTGQTIAKIGDAKRPEPQVVGRRIVRENPQTGAFDEVYKAPTQRTIAQQGGHIFSIDPETSETNALYSEPGKPIIGPHGVFLPPDVSLRRHAWQDTQGNEHPEQIFEAKQRTGWDLPSTVQRGPVQSPRQAWKPSQETPIGAWGKSPEEGGYGLNPDDPFWQEVGKGQSPFDESNPYSRSDQSETPTVWDGQSEQSRYNVWEPAGSRPKLPPPWDYRSGLGETSDLPAPFRATPELGPPQPWDRGEPPVHISRSGLGLGQDAPIPPLNPDDIVGGGNKFGQQVSMEGVHKGTDLQAYEGTQVIAPVSGTVVSVESEPEGLGLQVLIQGDDGSVYTLAHLLDSEVRPGDSVQQGQPVARVGESGAGATGPHLDYRIQDAAGGWQNPEPQLGALGQLPEAPNTVPEGAGKGQAAWEQGKPRPEDYADEDQWWDAYQQWAQQQQGKPIPRGLGFDQPYSENLEADSNINMMSLPDWAEQPKGMPSYNYREALDPSPWTSQGQRSHEQVGGMTGPYYGSAEDSPDYRRLRADDNPEPTYGAYRGYAEDTRPMQPTDIRGQQWNSSAAPPMSADTQHPQPQPWGAPTYDHPPQSQMNMSAEHPAPNGPMPPWQWEMPQIPPEISGTLAAAGAGGAVLANQLQQRLGGAAAGLAGALPAQLFDPNWHTGTTVGKGEDYNPFPPNPYDDYFYNTTGLPRPGSSSGGGGSGGENPNRFEDTGGSILDRQKLQQDQQRIDIERQRIDNEAEAEEGRHEAAMAAARNDADRIREQVRHDKAMEKIEGRKLDLQKEEMQLGAYDKAMARNAQYNIQGTFGQQQQAKLLQSALTNPWLQNLSGMAPGYGLPGWNAQTGGGVLQSLLNGWNPQQTPDFSYNEPVPSGPKWLRKDLERGASGGGMGGRSTDPLAAVMGSNPSTTAGWAQAGYGGYAPLGSAPPSPSYQQWRGMSPFERASWRTLEESAQPFPAAVQQTREQWANEGVFDAPNASRLSATNMDPMEMRGQNMTAEMFGQGPEDYWKNQSKTWAKAAAPTVTWGS